jgi:thiol-disulfide isomerase/thioredoxin
MFKKLLGVLLFTASFSFAQSVQNDPSKVFVTCVLENCSSVDSLCLFTIEGTKIVKTRAFKINADKTFTLDFPKLPYPQFFYISVNEGSEKFKPIIVSNEPNFKLTGPCYNISLTKTEGSKINDAWANAQNQSNAYKIEMGNIITEYRANYQDATKKKELEGKMGLVDKKKIKLLDSLKTANPFIYKLIALDTYISYQNSSFAKKYKDELDYFGTEYFHYVDFKDPQYNDIPVMFDYTKAYTNVMSQIGLSDATQRIYFDKLLERTTPRSKVYKIVLNSIVSTYLDQMTNKDASGNANMTYAKNMIVYGDKYLKDFGTDDMISTSRIQQVISQVKLNMIGIPAPEIEMNDRSDKPMKLSSLKGKVVLVDFWASWCGPCRRENPAVVALYSKYKSKGFEIFSVSLDQDKQKWLKAIEDDGLTWTSHVSDLQGWANAAARLYSVSSIPQTVLLDKEGNILARNLRGEQLADKLKSIFGDL